MLFKQGGGEFSLDGEICARAHEHNHNLAACKAPFDENMAQKARASVLVIGLNIEFGQHFADINDDFIGCFVLGHT